MTKLAEFILILVGTEFMMIFPTAIIGILYGLYTGSISILAMSIFLFVSFICAASACLSILVIFAKMFGGP